MATHPITSHLERHRARVTTLNDFYWSTRAGLHTLIVAVNKSGDGALPPELASRLDVNKIAPSEGVLAQQLRHVIVVLAVTHYEDYLTSILDEELRRKPLPNKKIRPQIDLADIPTSSGAHDFVVELYATTTTRDVVGEGYSKRITRVHRVLEIDPVKANPPIALDDDLIVAAGEARNCIVHTGGVVDSRARQALGPLFSGLGVTLKVGDTLPIDESLMFRLFGALKDHVEAIDGLVLLNRSPVTAP